MTVQNGYDKIFTDMVRRHEKIIFSVCFFYASADNPFDDLRQEVLISLFRGFSKFKGLSKESTWVYKVCINTCLLSIRKINNRVSTIPIEDIPGIEINDNTDEDTRSKLEWLHKAIATLGPMDKAIILMWLDDLNYDDIAGNMGLSRNTVASRIHRIKNKLSSKKEI